MSAPATYYPLLFRFQLHNYPITRLLNCVILRGFSPEQSRVHRHGLGVRSSGLCLRRRATYSNTATTTGKCRLTLVIIASRESLISAAAAGEALHQAPRFVRLWR